MAETSDMAEPVSCPPPVSEIVESSPPTSVAGSVVEVLAAFGSAPVVVLAAFGSAPVVVSSLVSVEDMVMPILDRSASSSY